MVEQVSSNKIDIIENKKIHNTQVFNSRFEFLNSHLGVRPGTLIGLMGTAGSGKSTLLKAIISDCASTDQVTVYLTEERQIDYEIDFFDMRANVDNIRFIDETILPYDEVDCDSCIRMMLEVYYLSNSKIIFLDNITTSKLYEKFGYSGQCKLIESLRKFTKDSGKTIFYVAHTKKNADNNGAELFNGGHIRGTYQAFQQAEYFYSLQPIEVTRGEVLTRYPILRVLKHRYHDILNHFFLLGYQDGEYKFDAVVDYERIKKIWKMRNSFK